MPKLLFKIGALSAKKLTNTSFLDKNCCDCFDGCTLLILDSLFVSRHWGAFSITSVTWNIRLQMEQN